jgi:hypothetical protein
MKRVAAALVAMLFAVNAHAATVSLGTPFWHDGRYHVPVIGTSLPAQFERIDNINLDFTGTLHVSWGPNAPYDDTLQTVWPKDTFPTLPFGQGGPVFTDIGLGDAWYVNASFQYVSECYNAAASSGILTTIPVEGCGTVALRQESYGKAYVCQDTQTSLTVNTTPVYFGCSGGGGGLDGMTGSTEGAPPPAAKTSTKHSTWGSIKALYR